MLIIGGDFNARIGKEGKLYNERTGRGEREEEFKGQCNQRGRGKNAEVGRRKGMAHSQWKGGETREFTYVEKRGATVIDYVMTNNTGLDMTVKFYVGDRIDSDYQPLCVTIKICGGNRSRRGSRKKDKMLEARKYREV